MQIRKVFLTAIPLLLLIAAPMAFTVALQTPTPIASTGDVAILVVDVFEEPIGAEAINLETLSSGDTNDPKPQCAISPDGQDGAAIRGGSVTSNMRPYALPHGRLVYKHFQSILENLYGPGAPNDPFIPTQESWVTPRGTIWLQAVDTQKYNIKAIATGVESAFNELDGLGVTHFVINMSFALVPCAEMPVLIADDYKSQLAAWGVDCPASGTPNAGFEALACELDNSSDDDFEDALLAMRDSGIEENAIAYAIIQQAVMRPKVEQAANADIVGTPEGAGPAFEEFIRFLPAGATVVQIASAGNDGYDYPYFPAISANVLSVAADYSTSSCPLPPVVQLDVENYLLSIGVTQDVTLIAKAITTPKSNKGEVEADGNTALTPADYFVPAPVGTNVFGCLFGTSFAAPQVSVLMAIDQQVRGTTECAVPPPLATVFDPPLAYKQWDSLDVPTAAATYCVDFPL